MRKFAAALALAVLFVACGADKQQQPLSGMVLTPPLDVSALSLPDHGTDFRFAAAPTHLLLVFFGYTNCPDVCPTTMSDIKTALKRLGPDSSKVDVAMVSVDPARDTDNVLTAFVHGFVPTGHALRTDDPARLQQVAKAFGASYSVTTQSSGAVEVSHSGNVYIIDSTGKVVVEWLFGVGPKVMANDLSILLSSGLA